MSGDVVARAKAALEGITDGPWEIESYVDHMSGGTTTYSLLDIEQYSGYRNSVCVGTDKALAEFIAAARSLVPELVAEVEKLRLRECSALCADVEADRDRLLAEVEKLRGVVESIRKVVADYSPSAAAPILAVIERAGIEP